MIVSYIYIIWLYRKLANYCASTSDQAILMDLIAGKEEAFKELYHRYYYRLLHVAIGLTKSHEVSEGIVHDVWVKIWDRRKKLRPEGSFKSLVYTMVRNLSLNHLREMSYRKGFEKELSENMADIVRHTENDVWFNLFQQQVDDIVASLPPQKKSIFFLSRKKGMSYEEIAKTLGIAPQTVANHINRTLEIIRCRLERIDTTDS